MPLGHPHDHRGDGGHRAAPRPGRLRGDRSGRRRGLRRLRTLPARGPLGAHAHPERMGAGNPAHRAPPGPEPVHLRAVSRRRGGAHRGADGGQRHPLPHHLRCVERRAQPGGPGARGKGQRPAHGGGVRLHRESGAYRRVLRRQDPGDGGARHRRGIPQGSERAAYPGARRYPGAGREAGVRRPAVADPQPLSLRARALRGGEVHRARRGRGAYRDLDPGQRRIASLDGAVRAQRPARRLRGRGRSRGGGGRRRPAAVHRRERREAGW